MVVLGAGWRMTHQTDRVIELRKEDATYRRITGRDGFVRVRAEPGMDKAALIDLARQKAQEDDARLAEIVGKQIILRRPHRYREQQRRLAWVFRTPEDPEIIGVKR